MPASKTTSKPSIPKDAVRYNLIREAYFSGKTINEMYDLKYPDTNRSLGTKPTIRSTLEDVRTDLLAHDPTWSDRLDAARITAVPVLERLQQTAISELYAYLDNPKKTPRGISDLLEATRKITTDLFDIAGVPNVDAMMSAMLGIKTKGEMLQEHMDKIAKTMPEVGKT